MRLVGTRVVLRPTRPEDADAFARGFIEDPTLGTMLGIEPEHENADWLRSTFVQGSDEGQQRTSCWFTITRPESDEPIGEIGLVAISWSDRRAGVSIQVLPGHRRAGAAREALDLLIQWAHSELSLHRIELHTLPENAAMQSLAEASGFAREGVLRDYTFERGRFVDNIVYGRILTSRTG